STGTSGVSPSTRICSNTPSSGASISITALSVSSSAITSPCLTLSPTEKCQQTSFPAVMLGEMAGILMITDICSAPRLIFKVAMAHTADGGCNAGRCRHDFAFQAVIIWHWNFQCSQTLDRCIKPVKSLFVDLG